MDKRFLSLFSLILLCVTSMSNAREIALTFDDAPTPDSVLMTGVERTQKIIAALKKANVPDALIFVKAGHIDSQNADRLTQYADAGFHLANHSFSHQSAGQIGVNAYAEDAYKAHLALKSFKNVLNFHRFPYLHYGKDLADINQLQALLTELGYKDGYVTVDNFDWYISSLITKAAEEKKTIDYEKARDFYVNSLYDSIEFYDAIAKKTLKRSPRHVLLLHENDAAALFIGDLVNHLRSKGWKIISPQQAYKDTIAKKFPQVALHKQGRVAAIASSKGIPDTELRHPSENEQYLDQAFAKAGVIVNQ
ncbi:polysaccharide deacetylase family protein [Cellvibrio sp. UBA7661]|uniref:polysaccharide deacetylase family protein n=1 Tax=Cellvibrio sp. UBA7661 TaxID=1946311 RepID=UPI002F35F9DC